LFITDSVISPAKFSAVINAIYPYNAAIDAPSPAMVVLAPVAHTSNAITYPYNANMVIPYKIHEPVN
jgi:hypothetical protein